MDDSYVHLSRDDVNRLYICRVTSEPCIRNFIVCIFGWFGCQPRHLMRISRAYVELGISTFCCIPASFRSRNAFRRDALIQRLLHWQELVPMSQPEEEEEGEEERANKKTNVPYRTFHTDVPLVIAFHVFSGSGSMFYDDVLLTLERLRTGDLNSYQGHNPVVPSLRTPDRPLRTLCTLFDSCPSALDVSTFAKALVGGARSSYYKWRGRRVRSEEITPAFYRHCLLTPLASCGLGCLLCCGFQSDLEELRRDVLVIQASLQLPLLFFYSVRDYVVTPDQVEDYIDQQREASDTIVLERVCWEDSNHVDHFRVHFEEYMDRIKRFFLKSARLQEENWGMELIGEFQRIC